MASSITLNAKSALAEHLKPGHLGVDGRHGLTLIERRDLETLGLSLRKEREAAASKALRDTLGLDLPDPGESAREGETAVLWAGLNRWYAVAPIQGAERLAGRLAPVMEGIASLTDQSSGYVTLELGGPRSRDLLGKGVSVDLDHDVFRPGMTAASQIYHMPVHLTRRDDERIEIRVMRSNAVSFWRWFGESAAEYGCAVSIKEPGAD